MPNNLIDSMYLNEEMRKIYLKRFRVISRYLNMEAMIVICAEEKVSKSELYRILKQEIKAPFN